MFRSVRLDTVPQNKLCSQAIKKCSDVSYEAKKIGDVCVQATCTINLDEPIERFSIMSVESIKFCNSFGFALLRFVIGEENSRHFFSQSDQNRS